MKFLVLNEIGIGDVISGKVCPMKDIDCNSYNPCKMNCPTNNRPVPEDR